METTTKSKFVIIGGAGKIAKYHFEAIEKVGGEVVAVIDPEGVDIAEQYKCLWCVEIDHYSIGMLPDPPEFYVICTPNNVHVDYAAWALKYGDVICEKPVAISVAELDWLISQESLGQTKVYPIMQMRKHPILKGLYERFQAKPPRRIHIGYVLPRKEDYHNSWQGDTNKSGGVIFNIAIHMIDFLVWTFEEWHDLSVALLTETGLVIDITFKKTYISLFFSTNPYGLPRRDIEFDGIYMNLASPLPLHTLAYQDIIEGHPLTLSDIKPTIQLCEEIRNYK